MQRGHETIIPNWALDAEETLTLMADAKVFKRLVRFRQYRDNTYSTLELAYRLEIDPRTVRASLERLREKGLILSHEGRHCSPEAASKLPPSQLKANASAAQAACKAAAKGLQKDPAQISENSVLDALEASLNKGSNELKEERNVSRVEGTDWAILQPSQQPNPETAQSPAQVPDLPEFGADAPAAGAATEDLPTPPQEKNGLAGQKTATLTGGLSVAAARPAAASVRQEHHGDDHDAVQMFHDIAGYAFVARYRADLARWYREYSPEFLRLAYKISGVLPGAKGIWTFADVLNRDPRREWPEELQAQYRADVQASIKPAAEAKESPVKVGDLLRFPDGETVTVLRLDHAQAVTDSDDLDRGYIAYSAIGRSVEVLHS